MELELNEPLVPLVRHAAEHINKLLSEYEREENAEVGSGGEGGVSRKGRRSTPNSETYLRVSISYKIPSGQSDQTYRARVAYVAAPVTQSATSYRTAVSWELSGHGLQMACTVAAYQRMNRFCEGMVTPSPSEVRIRPK